MEPVDSLLLVRLDPAFGRALARAGAERGLQAVQIEALSSPLMGSDPVLCVTEAAASDPGAFDRVAALAKQVPCPLVVLSRGLNADAVVRLIRTGIADVIEVPGPVDDVAVRALASRRPELDSAALTSIVGETPRMRELRREVSAAAPLHTTVLLLGETGTGKGLLARAIHDLSTWSDGPWVHVDCAALSPTVIESELFGHERGAFTGASSLRRGRFELAEGGSIFLDEVGDLDLSLQTKLLRVLEDREYERVGGCHTLAMTARVLAATSHDLTDAVRKGRFRPDLYFRLNVNRLPIPPLRERVEDIPLLVRHAICRLSERLRLPAPRVSDDCYRRLMEYAWPGNVRELMNVIERCLVQRRVEEIEADDIEGLLDDSVTAREPARRPSPVSPAGGVTVLGRPRIDGEREREIIERALRDTGGNVARAARRLGLARSTLRSRIKSHDLRGLIPRD